MPLNREPKRTGQRKLLRFFVKKAVIMMDNLRIYRMCENYVAYLHDIDHRVQYNKGERRPYVGVVLTIGQHSYFVPMESPRPNHAKLKSNIHIMKLENGKYGLLGFNNMLPAKEHHLIKLDIDSMPDANIKERQYKELLRNQLRFCNRHKQEIYEHALKTYEAVTIKKQRFLLGICCDFAKLEQEYAKFY